MIIRYTDGELAELGPNIKLYGSVTPSKNILYSMGTPGLKWSTMYANYLNADQAIRLSDGVHSDSIALDGHIWLDGDSVKIKSNGSVKNIDDIGGVAPISASWSALSNDMIPTTSGDYDIGSSSKRWDNLYLSGLLTGSRISLSGNLVMSSGILTAGTLHSNGETQINGTLDHDGSQIGFFGTSPATKQTGPNNMISSHNLLRRTYPSGIDTMMFRLATAIDKLADILSTYGLLTKVTS